MLHISSHTYSEDVSTILPELSDTVLTHEAIEYQLQCARSEISTVVYVELKGPNRS